MSSTAADWIAAHAAAIPASLARAMASAVGPDADGDAPEALSNAAVRCLRAALRLGDDRSAALQLLAADALLTAACEAAAAEGRDPRALGDRFAPGPLAAALAPELVLERTDG